MAFTALKLEKHTCVVLLLDGSQIECHVTNLTLGIQLLDYVCGKLGITESSFFGLRFRHYADGRYSWLQTKKFLGRQLRTKTYALQLHIKYWPSTPYVVEKDITRYQMVLDIRTKILHGQLTSSIPIQALLASYLLQAELGDYKDVLSSGGYHEFISNETLKFFPNQPSDFLEKVKEFHRKHHDVTTAAAELLYLENARRMLTYGMELHEVLDADSISVILGINHDGVHIIQNSVILNTMSWPNIISIKCNKRKRIIFLKLKAVNQEKFKTMKLGFISPTVVDWKRLYRSCRDQMAFFNAWIEEMVDGNVGKRKNADPTLRYSVLDDHHGIPVPFTRIDSARFYENKQKLQEDGIIEEKTEQKSAVTDEDEQKTNIEIFITEPCASTPSQSENLQSVALKDHPATPEIIISTMEESGEHEYSARTASKVYDEQSFVSTSTECDSVIENPLKHNDTITQTSETITQTKQETGEQKSVTIVTETDKQQDESWMKDEADPMANDLYIAEVANNVEDDMVIVETKENVEEVVTAQSENMAVVTQTIITTTTEIEALPHDDVGNLQNNGTIVNTKSETIVHADGTEEITTVIETTSVSADNQLSSSTTC